MDEMFVEQIEQIEQGITFGNTPLIISVLGVTILLILIVVIKKAIISKNKVTDDFIQQVNFGIGAGRDIFEVKKKDPLAKWNRYWGTKIKMAGLVDSVKYTDAQLGMIVVLILLVVYTLFTIMFQNIGIGLVPILSILVGATQILEMKAEKMQDIYDEQIPIFLSLLKSNIQAGEQPAPALLNAINETNMPLKAELEMAGKLIELGSMTQALNELRLRTSNDVLKFLCGCIEISTNVGANLEEQIEVIEEMLENNRALKRKLKVAISKNTPLLILSALLIPGIFIFTYFAQEQMRDFWFRVPVSWIAFGGVIGVYLAGVFLVKRIIKNTAKF